MSIIALFDVQIKTQKWLMRLIALIIFRQNNITNFKTIVILSMIVDLIINFTSLNKACAYCTTFICDKLKCWICYNVIASKRQRSYMFIRSFTFMKQSRRNSFHQRYFFLYNLWIFIIWHWKILSLINMFITII